MKAKHIICLALLVANSLNLIAQEKMHLITLEPVEAQNANFYFSAIQDDRQIKENIGVAQKGLANKQFPANFSEDFTTHLKNYFSAILPQKEGAVPLILKVNKLYISERTSAMSELGSCEVELEFLKEENGTLYALGSFKATVEGKGADVTPKHDKRIMEALQQSIEKFSASNWQNMDLTVTQNNQSQKPTFNSKATLKQGLYMDFEDLINNAPDQETLYRIKQIADTKKMEHFQVLQQDKNKRIKNVFGYSDGESIYLNSSRYTQTDYFIKSRLIGRYIYFEDYYSSPTAAAAFGVIGAVASARHTGIILDSKTGITTVLNNKNMADLLMDYPELENEYAQTKKTIEDDRRMIEKINTIEPAL